MYVILDLISILLCVLQQGTLSPVHGMASPETVAPPSRLPESSVDGPSSHPAVIRSRAVLPQTDTRQDFYIGASDTEDSGSEEEEEEDNNSVRQSDTEEGYKPVYIRGSDLERANHSDLEGSDEEVASASRRMLRRQSRSKGEQTPSPVRSFLEEAGLGEEGDTATPTPLTKHHGNEV